MNNPADIYLIGEQHTNEDHAQAEAEIIRDLEPDVVLRESFNDQDWDEVRHKIETIGQTYTIDELQDTMEEEYGEGRVFDNVDKLLEKNKGRTADGVVPTTENKLYSTPWPEMDATTVRYIAEAIQDQANEETEEWYRWAAEDTDGDPSDDDRIATLRTTADTYRTFHDVKTRPGSTALHRSMQAVYELRDEGQDVTAGGCDIDKQSYFGDMEGEDLKKALTDDHVIAERETAMAEQMASEADGSDTVVGIIGRYHVDGVRDRLEAAGYKVDGGAMPGNGGGHGYEDRMRSMYGDD
ncbi:MAG: hypothetical protein SV186_03390 [Candidatus Nanohaloarchaea archaeon]|nr:hypothetical protein [Candidatus Nanohaloarchaea archaeon]